MNRKGAGWPAAEGTIVASALEPDSDAGYTDKIVYQYTVDGQGYESSLLSYAGLSNDSTALQRRMAAYPVGKTVPVYYDPR